MDQSNLSFIVIFLGFFILALASRQVGDLFAKGRLPLITGFLFTGILVGPYVLKIAPEKTAEQLWFLDKLALAYIAFAAGSELVVRQIKSRFRTIRYTTIGLVVSTFFIGTTSFFLLSGFIPFTKIMPSIHRFAIALLAGAILVARSPSSAIAVVNELRAKGPFTKTALGVTVIMDVVVIILFSICISIADTLLAEQSFNLSFSFILATELTLSLFVGFLLFKFIRVILAFHWPRMFKTTIIILTGLGTFILSDTVRHAAYSYLSMEILVEPMLICMLAGFLTANHSPYRTELMKALHDVGPYIYIAFFTLTGISLRLDILLTCWSIAMALFLVRIFAIFIGTFLGGTLAGESCEHNRVAWMCYITQAGVGLGLAKEVSVEFPQWGAGFATIIISVIVLNQIVGPPFFKWVLYWVKEAQPKPKEQTWHGVRDVLIFGLDGESLALARLLQSNHWEVKIATTQVQYVQRVVNGSDIEMHSMPDLSLQTLNRLGVAHADAIVAMLSDEENFRVCELIVDNYGSRNLIVRLNHQAHFKRFHDLGTIIVEPSTAIVNLIDQFVRSPSATRLLLGLEKGRTIIEFELRNPDLQGVAIRDLHLPLDLHILSIRRNGQLIVSVGFTRLQIGDWLTVVGSNTSLEQMMLQFGENQKHALIHMVSRITAKQIISTKLEKEVEEILHTSDAGRKMRFNRFIEQSPVLEIAEPLSCDLLFEQVADVLSKTLDTPKAILHQMFIEREVEMSTALRPDLAIPHIIIDGRETFRILLARAKKGIYFSELAPKVRAVFVLVGTRDERDFHLYALSAVAEIVQQPYFRERWLQAKNEVALQQIALTSL
jgi:Trk K+ transport system NAD-binding subunit/Kef-type K+ transport system membrane component KefB/mannitol/fructose-specific phosphotransferase system IIA component (Ntr-type)